MNWIPCEERDETMNEWIPCGKREPDFDGVYLVTVRTRLFGRCIDCREFGVEYGWDDSLLDDIVAWQPLPTAYEGE